MFRCLRHSSLVSVYLLVTRTIPQVSSSLGSLGPQTVSNMSDSNGSKPVLLARLDFPPYCMKVISERHILIAGGGGSSKTGVPNCIDIYELVYDPVANTGRVNLVTRYDNG